MRYGVGMSVIQFPNEENIYIDQLCITFPWYLENKIIRLKYRVFNNKGMQRLLPKGGLWGFFGWNTVRKDDREVRTYVILIYTYSYSCLLTHLLTHSLTYLLTHSYLLTHTYSLTTLLTHLLLTHLLTSFIGNNNRR